MLHLRISLIILALYVPLGSSHRRYNVTILLIGSPETFASQIGSLGVKSTRSYAREHGYKVIMRVRQGEYSRHAGSSARQSVAGVYVSGVVMHDCINVMMKCTAVHSDADCPTAVIPVAFIPCGLCMHSDSLSTLKGCFHAPYALSQALSCVTAEGRAVRPKDARMAEKRKKRQEKVTSRICPLCIFCSGE